MKRQMTWLKAILLLVVLWGATQTARAYYDPGVQRWINRDPLEEDGGINLYAFANSGPVNWFDANGLTSTIQCDGNGNYETVLDDQAKKSAAKACIEQHEQDHINDWKKRYGEKSCQGKKKGELPTGDLPGEPPGSYEKFLKKSECDAYTREVECVKDVLSSCPPKDRASVTSLLAFDQKQKDKYCGKKRPKPR